jgi:phosphatidate cytidylyltransferase
VSWATGHEHHAGVLAAGIVALLITASAAGWILKLRAANGQPHATIDNLNARVCSWWIIAAAFGLALWAGRAALITLFAWVSFVALGEFLAGRTQTRADRVIHASCRWIAVPLQYLFIWLEWHALFFFFLPLYALIAVPLLRMAFASKQELQSAAGLLLCGYAISHVPAILMLEIAGHAERNLLLLAFLIVITQLSDVLQYLWGKAVGRHPIAPRISPAKTVEGALGGIACASLLGALLAPITPFSVVQAWVVALTIAVLGFAGGLWLSAIKRSRGIKDWSALIPGHGGMLDRLDSLVLSAPFFFYAVCWFWARQP